MSLVKFTRADGHTAIEIKALDATEEAFVQEFEETGRTARHKAVLQYSFDGKRNLSLGWKSRVSMKVRTKYVETDVTTDIDPGIFTYERYQRECMNRNFKTIKRHRDGNYHMYLRKFPVHNVDIQSHYSYLVIGKDTRKCWGMRLKVATDEFDIFIYETDLTVEKLNAIELKLGMSKS